ncbi:MAG: AbrB/MazE/SpoVT family DNA-binding domain-containing protein [Acidobacteriota bacterium]|nr:AbrB/MazE/SpoVT family DNA-binding domain-containing protein [Acidobacteriota bacterium]
MPTIVRVQKKGQVTIPTDLRSKAGIADGDLIEATFAHGKIILTPNIVLDRSRYPKADDEYTPEQRRSIDAQLKEAEKGPFHGPFDVDGAIAFMRKEIKARKSRQKSR